MVKEDYFSGSPDNPDRDPETTGPVRKNYGTSVEPLGRWEGVKVNYQIEIIPDKNGRMKF